jgi:putative ABC transport system permease protein
LQAASPAFETAGSLALWAVGVDIVLAFAYVLIFMAGLSIFIALFSSLKERRYDMAIMRSMGASRTKLFVMMVMEGSLLTLAGCVIGICLAHGIIWWLSAFC